MKNSYKKKFIIRVDIGIRADNLQEAIYILEDLLEETKCYWIGKVREVKELSNWKGL